MHALRHRVLMIWTDEDQIDVTWAGDLAADPGVHTARTIDHQRYVVAIAHRRDTECDRSLAQVQIGRAVQRVVIRRLDDESVAGARELVEVVEPVERCVDDLIGADAAGLVLDPAPHLDARKAVQIGLEACGIGFLLRSRSSNRLHVENLRRYKPRRSRPEPDCHQAAVILRISMSTPADYWPAA